MDEDAFEVPRGRVEDRRFLTGQGRFTDDLLAQTPHAAHALLLRSPYAHGDILSLDIAAAANAPGVLGVFTAEDLRADGLGPIPCTYPVAGKDGRESVVPYHPLLAEGRVRYPGEPYALLVAESLTAAQDAAELVNLEVAELPVVAETARALDPEAPQIWPEAPGNLVVDWETGDAAAVAAAFEAAVRVSEITVVNQRVAVSQLEPRAALGDYDPESGRLTLTTPGQGAHAIRGQLAEIFQLPEERLRVVTPDVGGAFGARVYSLSGQVLALWAARRLGRQVRWTADRGECFFTDGQARDHVSRASLALDGEGRFLGLRVEILANMGAYVMHYGPSIPTEFCCAVLAGPYRIPAIHAGVKCCVTNLVPTDTYRGTGRAEAIYLLERLVDRAARDLGLSPAEIRRRNFIAPEELPHSTPVGVTYDSGDFASVLEMALARADWPGAALRRERAAGEGKLLGIGLASYLATTGGLMDETAKLCLEPDGGFTLFVGTQSTGQGQATAFVSLARDALGLPEARIAVRQGDSDELPQGSGSSLSRSLLMGGLAVTGAVADWLQAARAEAARLLQVSARRADLQRWDSLPGRRGRARSPWPSWRQILAGEGKVLEACHEAKEAPLTFTNGSHICELTVERETGRVEILNYVAVDDAGQLVNRQIAAGQVHGGCAQGIGQALLEQVVYDP